MLLNRIIIIILGSLQFCYGQDKTLDYYLSQAKLNSPLLKDFQNQAGINAVDSLRLLATYKPQVNGLSNNLYAPTFHGWGYDQAITNGGQLSALVQVNKTIISKKYLDAQLNNFRLQNQSLQANSKISEQDLRKTITAQYITAYGDWQQIQFNTEVITLLRKEEDILKKLTDSAAYKQTDYLSFLVSVRQQELLLKQLTIQYKNDFATLNYLAGIIDTASYALQDPAISIEALPGYENSIFFKKYQVDSLQLRNDDALIDFTYKPKVSLFADGGFNSSFMETPYRNFGASFGVNLSVPIYDGKQRKMQHDRVTISEKTRSNYSEFAKTQYRQQIAQLLQQLEQTDQLLEETAAQVKYAQTLVEANRRQLLTGDVRITDYILSISNYLAARNIITQNTINKLQIINEINYWNRQ